MYRRFQALAFLLAIFTLIVQRVTAQTSENDAIKDVIRTETLAFFGRDADVWQSTWLHDAEVSRTIVTSANYSTATGWENFGPETVTWIQENPEPIPIELASDNFILHIDDSIAWVEYDETMTIPSMNYKGHSREHRALLKNDGQWKLISQTTYDHETYGATPEAIEERLNAIGYTLLQAEKLEQAIEVFKLNVQFYPQSWNTYDSLGEAYVEAGNKELAIKNYEKSIELNPENQNGKEALATLKQQ